MIKLHEINQPKWIIENSSFNHSGITLEECRRMSYEDIANGLTKLDIPKTKYWEVNLPKGKEFHLIGRVDTAQWGEDFIKKKKYYKDFTERNFIGFTEVWNKNVSHYKGNIFFLYDIIAEDIVHVFPCDSDTRKYAEKIEELSNLPSMCLSLNELERLSYEMETYCQITCRTKRNNEIIKPYAIMSLNEPNTKERQIAKAFEIGIVIVNPDDDAINYVGDLLSEGKLCDVSYYFKEKWDFGLKWLHYD
ncbi:MAG: hypothetical protein HFJ19_06015 [Clostridia bacterium]|nr:hypothetical protein [Clostridia bacterium]